MNSEELQKLSRNLSAVKILGFLMSALSIVGGGVIMSLMYSNSEMEKFPERFKAAQHSLFIGLIWLTLWIYVFSQINKLIVELNVKSSEK